MTLSGHTDWLNDVAMSEDGRYLATTGYDNTVKLWDAATGQELHTFADHSRVVNGLAFSPDTRRLASVGNDGFVIVYDLGNYERLAVVNGNDGAVRAAAFHPDSIHLARPTTMARCACGIPKPVAPATTCLDMPTVCKMWISTRMAVISSALRKIGRSIIWDMENGGPVYSVNPAEEPDDNFSATGVAFSPDGSRIITGYDDGVSRVWDFKMRGCCSTSSAMPAPFLTWPTARMAN
ncbi:MAG: hypothetical protein M5U34_30640 [Chloroflexi bacterium]|nr:hypothetical protein [Chloroflexota bacterium]